MKSNAVVVGASRGIGLTIANKLALEGWDVTIASRNLSRLELARKNAKEKGIDLNAETIDVTSEDSVINFFDQIKAKGKFDLFVNCAGANLSKLLIKKLDNGGVEKHPIMEWNRTIQLCLTGVFLCGREAGALMIEQNTSGTIINISSATRHGAYGQSAYTAAKAGVCALTRTWALELAKYEIRCVVIAPGVVEGEALKDACEGNSRHSTYMNKLKNHIPLRRWAQEEEIADTVLFIAKNKYVTGTVIEVDGGGVPERVY